MIITDNSDNSFEFNDNLKHNMDTIDFTINLDAINQIDTKLNAEDKAIKW